VTLVASDAAWWTLHADRLATYRGDRIIPCRYPRTEAVTGARPILSHEGIGFMPFNCGQTSLFAAISYALAAGEKRLALIGCDMRVVGNRVHYFGDHPSGLRQTTDYGQFLPDFDRAAKQLPAGVEILNCTEGSALRCFPFAKLEDVIHERNRTLGEVPAVFTELDEAGRDAGERAPGLSRG
jgi:hypothetical protein